MTPLTPPNGFVTAGAGSAPHGHGSLGAPVTSRYTLPLGASERSGPWGRRWLGDTHNDSERPGPWGTCRLGDGETTRSLGAEGPAGPARLGLVGPPAVVEPPHTGATRSGSESRKAWATLYIRHPGGSASTGDYKDATWSPLHPPFHGIMAWRGRSRATAGGGPPPARRPIAGPGTEGAVEPSNLAVAGRRRRGFATRARLGAWLAERRVRRAVKHMTPNLPHGAARSGARVLCRLGLTTPSARGFDQLPRRPSTEQVALEPRDEISSWQTGGGRPGSGR